MPDDVGPEQQPLELDQGINVFGNPFDFIVREVQFPQVGKCRQALGICSELDCCGCSTVLGAQILQSTGGGCRFCFCRARFHEAAEPPSRTSTSFHFCLVRSQSPHPFRTLKCGFVIGPNPGRVPCGMWTVQPLVGTDAQDKQQACCAQEAAKAGSSCSTRPWWLSYPKMRWACAASCFELENEGVGVFKLLNVPHALDKNDSNSVAVEVGGFGREQVGFYGGGLGPNGQRWAVGQC